MVRPADDPCLQNAIPSRALWKIVALALLLVWIPNPTWAETNEPNEPSPCQGSLDFLSAAYRDDPATRAAFQLTFERLKPLPPGYTYHGSTDNPWRKGNQNGKDLYLSVKRFYSQVCTLLPQIVGTNDNALDSIQYFAWLYYHNQAGRRMVEGIDPNNPSKRLDTVRDF